MAASTAARHAIKNNRLQVPGPPKVCKITACLAIHCGFGLYFGGPGSKNEKKERPGLTTGQQHRSTRLAPRRLPCCRAVCVDLRTTYIYIYVYIYIYIYVFVNLFLHTCAYIQVFIHTYTHIYTYMYIYTYTCKHTYIHIYACRHIYIHTYRRIDVRPL